MSNAFLESRVRIELEALSFVITVEEAQELLGQLEDILSGQSPVIHNTGGSFGFAPIPHEEDKNDE